MKTKAVLAQTVEQLERMNEALATLHRELLPGQPKKFALLAECPLEEMRRLQALRLSCQRFEPKPMKFPK